MCKTSYCLNDSLKCLIKCLTLLFSFGFKCMVITVWDNFPPPPLECAIKQDVCINPLIPLLFFNYSEERRSISCPLQLEICFVLSCLEAAVDIFNHISRTMFSCSEMSHFVNFAKLKPFLIYCIFFKANLLWDVLWLILSTRCKVKLWGWITSPDKEGYYMEPFTWVCRRGREKYILRVIGD